MTKKLGGILAAVSTRSAPMAGVDEGGCGLMSTS